MATKETHPNARPIILNGKEDEAFLLIHGYTGSPTDFNGLSHFLYEKRGASVYVPLLPGHGTEIEDLRGLSFVDFINFTEGELQNIFKKHKKVFIGGHSFGGQIALFLASKHPVEGVFITAAPVRVAFPLSIPGLYSLWKIFSRKEFFEKNRSEKELSMREKVKAFSYNAMPAYGLKLIQDMNRILIPQMSKITSPILSVYLHGDGIAHAESGEMIASLVSSKVKKNLILNALQHAAFFSDHAEDIYKEITEFFRK